ncbi:MULTISPECIES: hypothetical protein [Streptomyces]|uniref:hypothetical protein n=1 Tax=Streptomyces TaxID=1883 RepID=UPI00163DA128|nr:MULTISPECIES: hypothetical protein [unclassified Streptomyces]
MRTTLTPEFYQLFAVLLVAAMAVTFVVAAVADGAFVWLLRRLSARRQPRRATVPNVPDRGRTAPTADRTPVRR